jgi:ATP-dependent RNA helicase DeaD
VSNERKGESQMTGFKQFGIKEEILQAIKELYFIEPTPIQKQAIPLAMQGKDLIGQAQTGTGKTAAFVIPMLQKIDPKINDTQGLIMTPTRELAIQIAEDVQDLAKHMDVTVLALHGGKDIQAQMNKLNNKVQIIVGTPGRILDHLRRQTLHFGRLKMLVLDEADKMLEMGFQEDVETIIASTGPKKQTLLFSATMPDRVKHLAHRFMFQPPHVRVEMKQITAEKTKQYYYVMNQSDKLVNLETLLKELKPYLAIIFVNTQNRVEQVTEHLQLQGLEAKALHGGLSQNKREQLMDAFRQVKFQYLVCTDIAARGVDVEGVTHVVNYDLPSDSESYIHRVGRTGRAGEEGTAITFVSPRQKSIMGKIEKAIKQKIEEKLLTKRAGFKETLQEKDPDKRDRKTLKRGKASEDKPRMKPGTGKGKQVSPEDKPETTKEKKIVKPGYKKKQAMAMKREEQREKRKKINKHMTQKMREIKRKESRSSRNR